MAKNASNIRPLWFVSPLGITEDGNKPRVYPDADAQPQQDDGPQQAQPRAARGREPRGGGGFEIQAALAVGGAPGAKGDGYGFGIQRNNVITLAWTTKEAAEAYARDQAAKNPQTAYGVFACIGVVETTKPQVIEKKFSDSGELIVLEKVDNGTPEESTI